MDIIISFVFFPEGLQPMIKLMSSDNGDVKEAVTLALANLTSGNSSNCKYVSDVLIRSEQYIQWSLVQTVTINSNLLHCYIAQQMCLKKNVWDYRDDSTI